VGITDFVKNCVVRKDGQMVCWDAEAGGLVLLEMKKTAISPKDLTEDEIIEIMQKVSR
jgi:hypothetical protein